MLTLTRQGLLLSLSATVIPSQGSSDVPVSVTGDQSTYVGYAIEPRVGYYLNGIYKSIVCVYDSDAKTFDVPAEVFKQNGVIDITLALIDNTNANHIETCQAVHVTVNKAPLGTVVLPDQTTWQDYVLNYMKQNLDKLQGPQGPQGPQGAPGVNENVLHADIIKSENPSVDDAYEAPLQDLKMYGKSTQLTTNGYQLITYPPVEKTKTENGVTATYNDEDESITLTGTSTAGFNYIIIDNLILDPGDYTFSVDSALVTGLILFFRDMTNSNALVQIKDGTTYGYVTIDTQITTRIYFNIGYAGTVIGNKTYKVMLEKGKTPHTFEPYTGGKPSPSPDYPQEITKIEEVDCLVTGKNLFNINNEDQYYSNVLVSHTDTEIVKNYNIAPLLKIENLEVGTNYTISYHSETDEVIYKNQLKYSLSTQNERYPTGNFSNGIGNGTATYDNIITFEAPAETIYFIGSIKKETITQFQIEKGTTATAYEPYQSQHVQFTPPAPLYSILDGSVADYVDVVRGKYVYKLKKTLVTSSNINSLHDYGSYGHGFYFRFGDKVTGVSNSGICREIKTGIFGDVQALVFSDTTYLYAIHMFESAKTIDEIKQWLDEISGLNIVYQLATPTEQDIPAETLEALQALKTFNGVTNIFCNAPVSAQYEQSVQIVMNKILEQLNKLQTQTLNLQEEMINNV